jgi:hypothetical protein
MKTTQNQKIILKKKLDHTLGLGLIEHSTKEDFFGMKTTQNQKLIFKKLKLDHTLVLGLGLIEHLTKEDFNRNENYPKPEIYF